MPRKLAWLHIIFKHFAKNMEIGNAFGFCFGEYCRRELLPKFRIYMLGGINAETVNAEIVDPFSVYIDKALHHARVLGH